MKDEPDEGQSWIAKLHGMQRYENTSLSTGYLQASAPMGAQTYSANTLLNR